MIVGLLLMSLPLGAAEDEDAWVVQRQTWEHALAAGHGVVVSNPFGSIRVRGWDRPMVSAIANIQKRSVNPATATLESETADGQLILEVTFPSEEKPEWQKKPRRVDLTVLVPSNIEIVAKSANDLVEVKSFDGDVTAETGIGDIFVKTKGAVNITCRQGKITVFMMSTKWARPSSLETVHGTATVFFQDSANALVTVETAGKLVTDFSAEIETEPLKRKKRATIRIGQGGQPFEIRSNMGQIEIMRFFND